ncbi:MAG: hypothetical protein IJ316_03205 [Clostridia bacterium]|nr:hypothetical protein [Clostridia bacterium]
MKTTSDLLKVLNSKKSITEFLNENEDSLITEPVSTLLENLLKKKNLKKSDVIKAANLDRTYAYQIFSGTKKPSRNKLLSICFGIGLSFTETQELLNQSGYAPLYPKNKRDSIIIYCINKKLKIVETDIMLSENNEATLSSSD